MYGQAMEKEFYFNAKKFVKNYKKSVKKNKIKNYPLKITDLQGNDITFDVYETQISEEKIPNIYTFKGKSVNGNSIIYFTITNAGMTGSYSENDKELYIEPDPKHCKRHKIYYLVKKQKEGQIDDIVK